MTRGTLFATAAALLALAAPAQAAITQTAITNPSEGFALTTQATNPTGPYFNAAGTSNGKSGSGDKVDLWCTYRKDRSDKLTGPIAVDAGGSWSASVASYPY